VAGSVSNEPVESPTALYTLWGKCQFPLFHSVGPVVRVGAITIKDLGRWEYMERVQRYSRSVCLSGFAARYDGVCNSIFFPALDNKNKPNGVR